MSHWPPWPVNYFFGHENHKRRECSMTQHAQIGSGFQAIPSGFGLNDAAAYPRCGVGTGIGFGLVNLNNPQTTDRTVDIGLDRQSFLSRGWSNQQLGAWDNGAATDRGGLFLSIFY